MDPQGTNSQQVQGQQQQQQRYCPTPMAPPSPAPTPPIQQHHPPPSMSPAPHAHAGYYGHHTHHSYPPPPPQHNPYYTNYYGHSGSAHHHTQQSTNPTPTQPPPPPQQQQHYQQHQQQQWSQHHGYYQQSPQTQQQPQPQQQSAGYPAHSPSPNPYAYMQQQQQPQQQQQLGAPLGSPQGLQSQVVQQQQQQPQMQSQHALMNLSRFVSQQSPCPSPSPHPQSPTNTPLPPMGSPQHYPSPPQMQSHQGHHGIHGQQASLHHQQMQQQQHPLQSTTPTPIHQPTYSPGTSLTSSQQQQQQQQLSHPNQNAMMSMSQHVSSSSNSNGIAAMNSHQQQQLNNNNYGNTPSQSVSSSLGGMASNNSNSSSSVISNTSQGMMMASVGNGSNLLANQANIEQGSKSHPPNYGSPSASTNSNNVASDPHGSGSTSPSGSCSSSTTRTLISPSLTSNVNSSANNGGQMLPVRLQNMQRGPRTKASMRKFLEEQHSSSSAPETMQEGSVLSDIDTEGNAKSTQSTKKAPKKPRAVRKGAKGAVEEVEKKVEANSKKATKKRAQGSLQPVSDSVESDNTESATPTRPGYTKRGIKIGRPLKSKSTDETGKEPPKKKARKGKKGAVVNIENETNAEETTAAPVLSKSDDPVEKHGKSVISETDATPIQSEEKKESVIIQESPGNSASDFPSKEETESSFSSPPTAAKTPAKRTNKRSKSNSKKGKKDDDEWQLNPSTESESEVEEEEEEYVAPEIDRTPRRPLRPRVSKETPKSEEPETPTRSRYSRARRSSSSYKEVSMSSSRSKSPKEVVVTPAAPAASPKKSSRSTSPAKASSAKTSSTTKASAKKVSTPKSSPRIKEASPSPVRLRQLKARSPDDPKRELRSSKERDETPKRSPRARQTQNSKDAQQDAQETPPSSRRSSKSPRDPTPIRVCSPRLAKEKSAVTSPIPVKTPTANRRKNSVEIPTVVTDAPPPVLEEETVAPAAQTTKRKKPPPKPRGKKGTAEEATPESTTTSEAHVESSSPTFIPTPPSANKKGAKRGRNSAARSKAKSGKNRKKSQKEEMSNIPITTELVSPRDSAEESEPQSELLIDETPNEVSQEQLSHPVEDSSTGDQKTENFVDLTSTTVVTSVKSKSSRRTSTNSEGSRRSKSPRVSGGKSPEMIASANAALMAQCSSPRIILPNLTVNDLSKKYGEEQLSPDYVKMNTNNLSEQVASVIPAMESPTGKAATQQQQPNAKGMMMDVDGSIPKSEGQESFENAENSTASDMSTPSDSVKKTRKPRAPKAQKITQQPDESSDDQKHSDSNLENAEKLSSKQKAQIQFQQRKANLEVEVAQVLLEMKNSSKSPSPVKGVDLLINSQQVGSVLITDANNTAPDVSVTPVALPVKTTKGKRKNSTLSVGTPANGSNPLPVEPAENQIGLPTPVLPVKRKRAYVRKKPLSNTLDPNASTEPKTTSKGGGRKKSAEANEVKTPKTPKSRKKSTGTPAVAAETSVVESFHAGPPAVLTNSSEPQSLEGLPSVEISPGASIYSVSTSVSFQNSPMKVHGPVKVSKTVTIPEADAVTSNTEGATQESGKSKGKSKEKSPGEKSKKRKTVVPKALTPTAVPNSGEKPPKRKYIRKKSKDGSAAVSAPIADNQTQAEPKNVVGVNNSQTSVPLEATSAGTTTTSTSVPKSTEKASKKGILSDPATADTPTVKKRRKSSSSKVQSVEPLPFQLQPRPIPIPTVFAKPSPLAALKNGAGASSSDSKDKALVGPSLKVIGGKTTFYRGSDEEEVDSEPPIPKRTNVEYDPNVPWLCCFCNLGPHAQKLGDLFGPYYAEMSSGTGKTKSMEKRETWMHQDCALWAGNVVLIGTKLHNLEETLAHSNQDSCTTCGQKGATIGCLKRGCKQAVHFPCAVRKSWKLDQETFQSFCPAHVT